MISSTNSLFKNLTILVAFLILITSCGGGNKNPSATSGGVKVTQPTTQDSGSIQFEPNLYTFAETAGTQLLNISRKAGSKGRAVYKVSISGGTATPGQDFTLVLANLSWADGEQGVKTISTTIINNQVPNEGIENFTVKLSLVSGLATLAQDTAIVTITDTSNSSGIVQFSAPKFTALEDSGNKGAVVTVSRLNGTSGRASVNYTTADGTAVSGSDYQLSNGTLTWADGSDEAKNIYITILADSDITEGNETIKLSLSAASGTSIGTIANTTLTIYDVAGKATLGTQTSYLFYDAQDNIDPNALSKTIYAVDPTNPATPQFVTGTNFAFSQQILKLKNHSLGGTVNQLHTYALIYVDAGKLMRTSGLIADGAINLTNTKQISNESGISNQCELKMPGYTADREKQILFFTTGVRCDVWKYVELGRPNTLAATLAKEPVSELRDASGVATGYLAYDSGTGFVNLVKCNLDFTVCNTIIKRNIFMAKEINTASNGKLLLEINGNLYWYDKTTGLSNVIYTKPTGTFLNFYSSVDTNDQYIIDGTSIYTLKLDGISKPKILVSEKSNVQRQLLFIQGETTGNIIYSITDSANNSEVRLIAKNGSDNAVSKILATTTKARYAIFAIRNSRIYYNIYPTDVTLAMKSGMIMEDGSSKKEFANSYWAGGFSSGSMHPADILLETLIQVNSVNDVLVYNIAAFTRGITLGKVEAGRSMFYIGGSSRYGIGFSLNTASTVFPFTESDVYFADVNTANSLIKLTNTPKVKETLIF